MAVDSRDKEAAYTFRVTYYSGAAEIIKVEGPPQRVDTALVELLSLLMDRTQAAAESTPETSLTVVRGIERLG